MISEQSVVVVSRNQVSGELHDGDVAILNMKDGVYYGLNSVGGRIWSLIQVPRTVAELRDILLKEYDVEQEKCTREVMALLEDLLSKGLIEITNGPAG